MQILQYVRKVSWFGMLYLNQCELFSITEPPGIEQHDKCYNLTTLSKTNKFPSSAPKCVTRACEISREFTLPLILHSPSSLFSVADGWSEIQRQITILDEDKYLRKWRLPSSPSETQNETVAWCRLVRHKNYGSHHKIQLPAQLTFWLENCQPISRKRGIACDIYSHINWIRHLCQSFDSLITEAMLLVISYWVKEGKS